MAEGFPRRVISSGDERTTVDLAWDARLSPQPPERIPEGLVLVEEKLAVDQMFALFWRAAARDFVDVWVLASRFR